MSRDRRSFTPEFKAGAVEMVEAAGGNIAQVAKELGIYASTLGNWVRQAHRQTAGAPTAQERAGVFISYAHNDQIWLDTLLEHLDGIGDQGVPIWTDREIAPGAEWHEAIQAALARAQVAILMVSDDFLFSSYVTRHELPTMLKAAKSKDLTIFWIPLKPSEYQNTEIARFEAAHPPESPLARLGDADRDKAFEAISRKLAGILHITLPRLTANWRYGTSWENGRSDGYFELRQSGSSISGIARITQYDKRHRVRVAVEEELKGAIRASEIQLEAFSCTILEGTVDYNRDVWDGSLSADGTTITGQTSDGVSPPSNFELVRTSRQW